MTFSRGRGLGVVWSTKLKGVSGVDFTTQELTNFDIISILA